MTMMTRHVTIALALLLVASWFVVAPASAQSPKPDSQPADSFVVSPQLDPTAAPPTPATPTPRPKKCVTVPCGPKP
jgi:hypothetical protein